MTIVTPGVEPASKLVTGRSPKWLKAWARFAKEASYDALPAEVVSRTRLVVLELTAKLPAQRPARVRVWLKDGRTLEETALTNKGDTEDPYSADEVIAKFHEVAGAFVKHARLREVSKAILALDAEPDLSRLNSLVREPT